MQCSMSHSKEFQRSSREHFCLILARDLLPWPPKASEHPEESTGSNSQFVSKTSGLLSDCFCRHSGAHRGQESRLQARPDLEAAPRGYKDCFVVQH